MNRLSLATPILLAFLPVCAPGAAEAAGTLASADDAAASLGSAGDATARFASAGVTLAPFAPPLRFEENLGQTNAQVRYLARAAAGTVFLTPREIVATVTSAERTPPVRLQLVGASPAAVFGAGRLPGRTHYLKGNDPSAWHRNVPAYRRVRYTDAWPGVDLSVYGTPDHRLEFDVIAAPRADLEQVRLRVPGALAAEIEADGTIALARAEGEIRLRLPAVWQDGAGAREPVSGRFVVHGIDGSGAEIGFALEGRDASRTVVIDPVLEYSSYLGGLDGQDEALDIAVDQDGCAYVLGFTNSPDFPLLNAFDTTLEAGNYDAFVTKFSADGSSIVYSTLLGGDRDDAFVYGGIDVDAAGNAYVGGITGGGTFPTTGGAHQGTPQGLNDGFVSAISPDGSSLLWSTFLGGSLHDKCVDVAVDESGNVFAIGDTGSNDFPTTPGAFDSTLSALDMWVAKVSGGGLAFSTLVGGSHNDDARAIDARGGTPYGCGSSFSNDFPSTGGAVSDSGSVDAVAFRLDAAGTAVLFSTYLAGEDLDRAHGIAVDADSSVYVCGITDSDDYPTTAGAYQEVHPTAGFPNVDAAFVTKVVPGGGGIAYSTFLGGFGFNRAWSIDVRNGEAAVSGTTTANDFPLVNALQTPQNSNDAFVTQFADDGASLLFSTVLAGNSSDNARDGAGGIVVGTDGALHVSGTTSSDNFFTTSGAFQEADPGPGSGPDAFVVKIQPSAATGAPAVAGEIAAATLELTSGPNPFRGSVRLAFTLPAPSDARLDIVDVSGRRVQTLSATGLPAGESSVRWDGRDEGGASVAAGVYLARLVAGGRTATARLVLVR